MPLVSVVIPAYNSARYLPMCIDSALGQKHLLVEIIVVNDGSTDDTDEVIFPYLSKIKYLRQENKGLSAARNFGFKAGTGDYICFLDADDILMPDKFEKQLEKFRQEPDLGVVISGYYDVDYDGKTIIQAVKKSWNRDGLHRLLNHEVFPPHAALIRREVLEHSNLFPEDIETGESQEDWQLWLDLALSNVHFGSVSAPTCLYRRNVNGSISSNLLKHMNGARRVVNWLKNEPRARKYFKEIDRLAAIIEVTTAGRAYRIGKLDTAIETFCSAVKIYPCYWKTPAIFKKLFENTLDTTEISTWNNDPDISIFEKTVIKTFIFKSKKRLSQNQFQQLAAIAYLQIADLAYAKKDIKLIRTALFNAVSNSLTTCFHRNAFPSFVRCISGPTIGRFIGNIKRSFF